MRRPARRDDGGFTLVELVITVLILGVITLPLGNFVLAYFQNVTDTQSRLSDSHDIQIATAYFSQDVANTGLHDSTQPYGSMTSVWTSASASLPASYCGQGTGSIVLLLKWDAWTATTVGGLPTATNLPSSAAYVIESGALHRVYCASGSSVSSDATLVHNLQTATVQCASPATCDGATPPKTITLSLGISGGAVDHAAPPQPVTLTGQRRQS